LIKNIVVQQAHLSCK